MKIKSLLGGIVSDSAYFKAVVEAKRRIFTYKKPVSKVQAASTQATLDRDPSKDEEHYNRPLVDGTVYKDGQIFLNERAFSGPLDLASLQSASDLRLKGHYNVLGQSPLSGNLKQRAAAVEAFMAQKGVILTDAEKLLIHRYYEVMQYPDAVPTRDDMETIRKFHELVDHEAQLVGDKE